MNHAATHAIPTPSRLYLADILAELAGPDLDVALDEYLQDDAVPLARRQEVAAAREELVRTAKRQLEYLHTAIAERHRMHADRAEYEQARREAEQRREQERAEADRRRQAERIALDVARRRAEQLGFRLEPIRIRHESPARDLGRGHVSTTSEEHAWRVTAPRDHPAVEHNREHLVPTLDGKGVELQRGSIRSCCEWIALHAAAHRDTPAPEPRGKLRRRREGS